MAAFGTRRTPSVLVPRADEESCPVHPPRYTTFVLLDDLSSPEAIRLHARLSSDLFTATGKGVDPDAMARLERDGVLYRVIPGVYLGAQHARHPLVEAAAWVMRHPRTVVGLLTAAVNHDLVDAFARGTWLFVPLGCSVPRSRVVQVQVVQTALKFVDPALDAENGIGTIRVHGIDVRITDPDRTTLDLWRYPRRISSEHAIEALRRRVRAKGFEMPRFARLARRLHVWDRVERIVQGLALR